MTKRKSDLLWDVAVALCNGGGKGPITKSERGKWNKGIAEIRRVGGTPEQLRAAIAVYKRRNKGMACNPMAIAGQWGRLMANGQVSMAETRLRDLESRWHDVPLEARWRLAEKVAQGSPYGLNARELRQALALWDKEQQP